MLAAQLNAEASGQQFWQEDVPSTSQPAQSQSEQLPSAPESSHQAAAVSSADAQQAAGQQQAGSSRDAQPEASGRSAKEKPVQVDDDEEWEPATAGADSSDDESDEDAGMQLAMLPEGVDSLDPAVRMLPAYPLQRDCMSMHGCPAM